MRHFSHENAARFAESRRIWQKRRNTLPAQIQRQTIKLWRVSYQKAQHKFLIGVAFFLTHTVIPCITRIYENLFYLQFTAQLYSGCIIICAIICIYRFSSIKRPGLFFRLPIYPAFIGGRRLFSHVQISRTLVVHLTHTWRVLAAITYYKRLHGHQTGRPRRQVHTTCTRASTTWILRHAPPPPRLIDPAFNRGSAFISRTSVLTLGVY